MSSKVQILVGQLGHHFKILLDSTGHKLEAHVGTTLSAGMLGRPGRADHGGGRRLTVNKGLTDQFSHLIPPTAEDQGLAISEGMVAVDANVLLTLYLYSSEARSHFVSALAQLNDRLWLPHQAALEFHRNRLFIINEQGKSYKEMLANLQAYRTEVQKLEMRVRAFSNRIGLAAPDKDRLTGLLIPDIDSATQMVRDLEASQEDFDPSSPDPVLLQLESIFAGKVGESYDAKAQEEASSEAKRRIESRIPPGYKDSAKVDSSGDYILWDQTLVEAARRKPKYLLFMTSDQKEDWVLRVRGKTLGPRPELALEAQQRAGCRLVIMSPNKFLVLASTHSHTQISNATLEEGVRVADRVEEIQKRLGRNYRPEQDRNR